MDELTGISIFKITKETCFVCGKEADTLEHLFPKWLLKKFNLWNEKLRLPNNTLIAYKNLTVPCCKKCNNETYSVLERRISTGMEDEKDIWRWGNKIHFALTVKDGFLEWDRKHPGYKIGDVFSPLDPLEQSRHFLHCVSGDFTTHPDPFGSVFKFIFSSPQQYNFIHLIASNSLCISLGDRGYIVFVKDGQVLKNNRKDRLLEMHKKQKLELIDMLFFYAQSVEYAARYELSVPVAITRGLIVKTGQAVIKEQKPPNKELLAALCKAMGFTWVDSGG